MGVRSNLRRGRETRRQDINLSSQIEGRRNAAPGNVGGVKSFVGGGASIGIPHTSGTSSICT